VRNGVLTLVLCLMATTFGAVLLEHRRPPCEAASPVGRAGWHAEARAPGSAAPDGSSG